MNRTIHSKSYILHQLPRIIHFKPHLAHRPPDSAHHTSLHSSPCIMYHIAHRTSYIVHITSYIIQHTSQQTTYYISHSTPYKITHCPRDIPPDPTMTPCSKKNNFSSFRQKIVRWLARQIRSHIFWAVASATILQGRPLFADIDSWRCCHRCNTTTTTSTYVPIEA